MAILHLFKGRDDVQAQLNEYADGVDFTPQPLESFDIPDNRAFYPIAEPAEHGTRMRIHELIASVTPATLERLGALTQPRIISPGAHL